MKSILHKIFYCIPVFFLGISCKEAPIKPTEEYYSVIKPSMDPGFPFDIEQDSLVYRSSVIELGTLNLKRYGICFGQNPNPTLLDRIEFSKTPLDSLPFFFDNKVKNLTLGTTYQVRSFVITAKDTLYGISNYFRTHGRNEWVNRLKREQIPTASGKPLDLSPLNSQITTSFDENRIFMLFKSNNRLYEYDVKKFLWFEKKILPTALKGNTNKYSFMANSKVFCGNLLKVGNKLESEFWEYDIKTDIWRNANNNKPDIELQSTFGFNDNNNGYIITQSPQNTWKLLRYEATIGTWKLINEGFNNENIVNIISDGANTFAITNSSQIFKLKNDKWEYFINASEFIENSGINGYFGWVLHDKLYLGEYVPNSSIKKVEIIKSVNLINKEIEPLPIQFILDLGAFQTTKKMFFGHTLVISEYYPK